MIFSDDSWASLRYISPLPGFFRLVKGIDILASGRGSKVTKGGGARRFGSEPTNLSLAGTISFLPYPLENKMAKQKQRQAQKQVVIVNVGTSGKRKGGKRKARSAPAPAVMVQQIIPPIPLSVQPQPQADFASQFMKALAGIGEGVTVKKDTVAPQVTLNNPNNANIAQEQQAIQITKGMPMWAIEEQDLYKPVKASEPAVSETDGKQEGIGMPSLGNIPMMNEPAMPSQAMSSAEAIRLNGPPIGLPSAFPKKDIEYRVRTDAEGKKYREWSIGKGWNVIQYKGETDYTKVPPFPGLSAPNMVKRKDGTPAGSYTPKNPTE